MRLILVEEGYTIEDVVAQIKEIARILRSEPPKEQFLLLEVYS